MNQTYSHRTIASYICTLWYTLVHSGTLWYTLIHTGTLWFTQVHFGIFWFTLVHSGSPQDTLVHFGTSQCTLAHFGTSQYTLVHFGTLWYTLVQLYLSESPFRIDQRSKFYLKAFRQRHLLHRCMICQLLLTVSTANLFLFSKGMMEVETGCQWITIYQ